MSLFDDWRRDEEPSTSYAGFTPYEEPESKADAVEEELPAAGGFHREKDEAIFRLERLDLGGSGFGGQIVSAAAGNKVLVIALRGCKVVWWNLDLDEVEDAIEVSKRSEDEIHKLFLDPTGSHCLVAMRSNELYYLHSRGGKPRQLRAAKGIRVESVAWDRLEGTDVGTKVILLGSSDGSIYETLIQDGKEKHFKQVHSLAFDAPVCGLQFERFPSAGDGEPEKFFVMAATPTRYYQYVGGPTFEALFSHYVSSNKGFVEIPGELDYTELHFYSKYKEERAKAFAWLTPVGVYHGNLLFGSQGPGDPVVSGYKLLSYPGAAKLGRRATVPTALTLTEFHFLLLYPHHFTIISQLNEETVFEGSTPPGSTRLLGLARDRAHNAIWLYSESAIFQLVVTSEDRDVWQLYLEKKKFEQALQYCKEPAQRDRVRTVQADHYFAQGKYELAAKYYAKTHRSFEEVALKFVHQRERDALKTFLRKKLQSLAPTDKTQHTMICTWLTEVFLDKLNELQSGPRKDDMEAQSQLVYEFRQFLNKYRDHLDSATTYHLLASHGRMKELLFYADLTEDFERQVSHHVEQGDYEEALRVLVKAPPERVERLFYKYSPVLMEHEPALTVDCWIDVAYLQPWRLIPALMRYSQKRPLDPELRDDEDHAIRYLEEIVYSGNRDPSIHNYLLSLYAAQPGEKGLLEFLRNHGRDPVFDLKYALRICAKEGKTVASVQIYSYMGLYEEAVDLALLVDIDLAKTNADKPEDDELRKKLWLRIAHHLIKERVDITGAIQLLHECKLLKIEDVLPFFPDFVQIDTFKEEICDSLEEYNSRIKALKAEMDDYTRSADRIRHDISTLRTRFGYVGGKQKCELCGQPVLLRGFYLFPCTHVFHSDCLIAAVRKTFNRVQCAKLDELQEQLEAERSRGGDAGKRDEMLGDGAADLPRIDFLQNELDDLVASECLFCGETMIQSIGEPFVGDDDVAESREWAI